MELVKQNQKSKLYFSAIEAVVCKLEAPCYKQKMDDSKVRAVTKGSEKIKKCLAFNQLNVYCYRRVYRSIHKLSLALGKLFVGNSQTDLILQ